MDTSVHPAAPAMPSSTPCWSDVLKRTAVPKPEEPISSRVFGDVKSSNGISVAVVDANAIIHGDKLTSSVDKFVTVSEVIDEVRDPVSRQRLAFLPIHVETMEPSADALKKVVKFSRETGDLQSLSDADIKVIALAYTLEYQIHGTLHLRERPPPLRMVSVKHLPEVDMPGWGKNVPNLAEWEDIENLSEGHDMNSESKILPLKDLNLNNVSLSGAVGSTDGEDNAFFAGRPIRYDHPKKEIKTEGKIIADGIDASQGEHCDSTDDWQPAVSRSTRRRFLRRKARSELSEASEKADLLEIEVGTNASVVENSDIHSDGGSEFPGPLDDQSIEEHQILSSTPENDKLEIVSSSPEFIDSTILDADINDVSKPSKANVKLEIVSSSPEFIDSTILDADINDLSKPSKADEIGICSVQLDQMEISSHDDEIANSFHINDTCSEQSWALRSLSESTVACVTSDFAMQNVILQIGLRLLVPGGMQIRQLHRWVLKCHACNTVTSEIGRIFCPKCGNGGTLRKVSTTVGENGIVLASRRPRINLRGTKFSVPMPQGGRDGITKNPVLREDQLPKKFLYPGKKKNKQENEFFSVDDIFSHCCEKKSPLKPPVGKAVAVFSGRRNPNDNHFSRRKL